MKRTWTIESATSYAAANSMSNRGLKFCSAIDFLRSKNVPVAEYLTMPKTKSAKRKNK